MNEQEAKAIVLEWLKEQTGKAASPLITINYFENDFFSYDLPGEVVQAYDSISRHTEYELLAEFAAWGLKEGAKRRAVNS